MMDCINLAHTFSDNISILNQEISSGNELHRNLLRVAQKELYTQHVLHTHSNWKFVTPHEDKVGNSLFSQMEIPLSEKTFVGGIC